MLHIICREGYLAMLEFLVNPKNHSSFDDTDVEFDILNDRKRTPLHLCFTPPILTYNAMLHGLSEAGMPNTVKPDDVESLVDWIHPGGVEERQGLVEVLLNQGVDPNVKDYHDFAALHYATIWGWDTTVKLLLENGADVNAATISGTNALMMAVEFKHVGCVSVILKETEKLDKRCTDVDGVTPLLMACEIPEENVKLEIVELLLKAGFDVDREDKRRRSALSIACKSNCAPLVHKLLDHKCRRRKSLFDLLEGAAAKDLAKRFDNELKLAKALAEEMARLERQKEEEGSDMEVDWRSSALGRQNPLGQWVQYNDKRGRGIFYYNTVSPSRISCHEHICSDSFSDAAFVRPGESRKPVGGASRLQDPSRSHSSIRHIRDELLSLAF